MQPAKTTFRRPAPVAFGRSCGWLHSGSTRHGVLMCAPLGFEALCTRLSWNVLGDMLASRGLHALRFDYPGEGDALERREGETAAQAAIAGIREAAAWFMDHAKLETLSVVGLRLGSVFAQQALHDVPLKRAAWLAPVFRGKAHVREQQMTAKVFAAHREGLEVGDGETNICGFVSSKQDNEAISALNLGSVAAEVLLLLEPGRAAPLEFQAHEAQIFDGYTDFMLSPTEAVTPFVTLERVADWLATDGEIVEGTEPPPPGEAVLRGHDFKETCFRFGEAGELAGVLTEPLEGRSDRCVHLMNAGANYHIGWARMSVEQARTLARGGFSVMRYDFAGVGDSIWFEDGPRPHMFSARHLADAEAAIAAMAARGYDRHVLAGLCAGGYVAFHIAARNETVDAALIANALRLVWRHDDTLDAVTQQIMQPKEVYRAKLRSVEEWKRLFTGQVSAKRLLTVVTSISRQIIRRGAGLLGTEPAPDADAKLARQALEKATTRGTRIAFVHAESDQSRDEADRRFGIDAGFARKQPGVTITLVARADHEFTQRGAQAVFLATVQDLLAPTR